MIKKILFILLICLFLPVIALADDWYVRDFNTQINVNQDSSLAITERITADCGNALGKHGIFRVLPTKMNVDGKLVNIPIKLISITDFNGNPIKYSVINNYSDNTVTFKIGDAKKTVQGVNYYQIVYSVKNTIRFYDSYDQLYWNLTGNFWELNIDKSFASIIFPEEINENNSNTKIFIGELGSQNLLTGIWENNVLNVSNNTMLYPRQGISIMIDFPKEIFTASKLTFLEKYSKTLGYLWLLIPISVFIFCFSIWKKYGKEYSISKTITPEFGPPQDLSPAEIGLISNFGKVSGAVITSTIINLATREILKIEEIDRKWMLGGKDYKLTIIDQGKLKEVSQAEKMIIDEIFSGYDPVHISALKQDFRKKLPNLQKKIRNLMYSQGLLVNNKRVNGLMSIPFIIFIILWIILGNIKPRNETIARFAILASFFISFIFLMFMPKRTQKGAELNWQIKGFKLYMETAEKYRQQFFEKENMFEKLLPYAIVFGITKI